MSISLAAARELQDRVRAEPKSAPAIIGDLIAEINAQAHHAKIHAGTVTGRMHSIAPSFQSIPKQVTPETTEQREQRLLEELEAVNVQKAEAAAKAKAEAALKVRLDAIDHDYAVSAARSELLQSIRSVVNYNSGDVDSRDTWWKFRKDLAPTAAAHGFKLVNVGTKSKPKAALAEV